MNCTRLLAAAAFLIFLFASCAPKVAPVPTSAPSPAPTATPVPHALAIRFALIGTVTPINVWALFDAKGYSYNNYAVMSGYWPRLYQLSIPDRNFEPMAASGMPASFQQEGNFYTATVPLRPDLKWTDGNPFTADDVVFTVNTALSFQLGFDWHDFYNPDYIDHAEAVDAQTVKFYFKRQPNVGVWQYGALQGPIVQKAYWASKVSASATLLPSTDLAPQIASLNAQAADLQSKINNVNANIAILSTTSSGYIQGIADIKSLQANLNQTNTAIAKAQAQYDSAMDAARQSLYALDNANEPTLGDWMPAGQQNGAWTNKVNPAHPFYAPKFDRAMYSYYADETSAIKSLREGNVNSILASGGISIDATSEISASMPSVNPSILIWANLNHSFGFLVFNSENQDVANTTLHNVMFCLLGNNALADPVTLLHGGLFNTFVLPGEFLHNNNGLPPCDELTQENDRVQKSVELLNLLDIRGIWNLKLE